MLSMTLEKRFFRDNQENNHIRKADQRQVVCNQLTRRALGTECSLSTCSVCWTPPHYKPSKIQSEWAVWFFFINAGVDQALPQERRTPVTPSSSSRYHRRRSSGSRDERYRSGEWNWTPQSWNENLKCLVLFLTFLKRSLLWTHVAINGKHSLCECRDTVQACRGGVTKPRYIWNWIWQRVWRAAKRPSTGTLVKEERVGKIRWMGQETGWQRAWKRQR